MDFTAGLWRNANRPRVLALDKPTLIARVDEE
jgi:hypothetical protein